MCKVIHPWRRYHHSGPVAEETWVVCPHCEAELREHLKETIEHGFPSAGAYALWASLVVFGPAAALYAVFLVAGRISLYATVGLPLALAATGILCWGLLRQHPIWVNLGKPSKTPMGTPLRDSVSVARGFTLAVGIGLPLLALMLLLLGYLN